MTDFVVYRKGEDPDLDGWKLQAFNAEHAAKEWAELEDASREFEICNGNTETCIVRNLLDGTEKTFQLSGEVASFYFAYEIDQ